jgi:SAM-dependent methyltransferase
MPVPINGLAQHYEVPAGEFFAHHDQQEKFKTARLILEDAERMIGRTGKLLDIGAGRGETLKLALDTGWDAYGIEPSASFAASAQELCGRALYTKPLEECDLPQNEFDVVILSAVLEHLYDPRSVIAEIARVLKSGGVLFLDVPNERGLFFKVGNLYQRFRSREWCINLSPTFPPFHLFGFSPKSLRMLLNAEGLDLTKLFVFGGECVLESRRGILGSIERSAAKLITAASNFSRMGSYIAAWAQKSRDLEP